MSDTRVDLAPQPSYITGPTWQRTKSGHWYLPKLTLGWAVLAWMITYLRQTGGKNAGQEFVPTKEQQRFILWWYAVDETGRFVYRSGVLRRLKGWGKDPLVAALALAELCGPAAFDRFDPEAVGGVVGKTHHSAWIQVAAVSQDQTANTFRLFPAMVTEKLKAEFNLEVLKTVIHAKNGGLIQAVTSSPKALEGQRPTLVIMNEVQWWMETNEGHALYDVLDGNVTKSDGGTARYLAICNAHIKGQESIGERLYETHQKVLAGKAIDTGILYDALEAPPDVKVSEIPNPLIDPEGFELGVERLKDALRVARGDAVWLDLDAIVASILDLNNPLSESVRKFLNWVNASEDAWMDTQVWDACQVDGLKLEAKDTITLGFDGSKSSDFTALVACRVEDGALFLLKHWDPKDYPNHEIPREQVDALVRWAFSRFNVVAFRADVKEFESYVDQWGQDFKRKLKVNATPGNPVAFDMRGQTKRFAFDCERFLEAALEGSTESNDLKPLIHDGNKLLRAHVGNACMNPTTFDAVSIRKVTKDSDRKIDAAVCAVLAYGARHDYLMSKRSRSGKVGIF